MRQQDKTRVVVDLTSRRHAPLNRRRTDVQPTGGSVRQHIVAYPTGRDATVRSTVVVMQAMKAKTLVHSVDLGNSNACKCSCPACPIPMPPSRFSDSRRCVPGRWMCDGANDCADKSDELTKECMNSTPAPCSEGQFRCDSGKCLTEDQVRVECIVSMYVCTCRYATALQTV